MWHVTHLFIIYKSWVIPYYVVTSAKMMIWKKKNILLLSDTHNLPKSYTIHFNWVILTSKCSSLQLIYFLSQGFSHTTSSSPRSSAQKNLLKFNCFIHSHFAFFRFSSILEILRSRLWWWCYSSNILWTIFTSKTESHDLQSRMATDDNLNQTNLGLCEPLRIKSQIARHSMKPRSDPMNRATLDENSVKRIWRYANIFTWKIES